jgi:hypothetical protein
MKLNDKLKLPLRKSKAIFEKNQGVIKFKDVSFDLVKCMENGEIIKK